MRYLTLNLGGGNRTKLLDPQPWGDLKNPQNSLAKLFTSDEKRLRLRKIVHDAFGLYLALDVQNGQQLHVRFGLAEPPDERSLHDNALSYMREARDIGEVREVASQF